MAQLPVGDGVHLGTNGPFGDGAFDFHLTLAGAPADAAVIATAVHAGLG